MSHVFQNQSLLTVAIPTGFETLEDATVTLIKYVRPSGRKGSFEGDVSGNNLVYEVEPGDIPEWGLWAFQSFVTVDGRDGYGEIVYHYFEKPL